MDAKFITNFDNRSRFYVEWSVMNHETGAHHNGTQGPMICRSFLRREQILWPLQSLGPWLSSFGALNTWNERNKRLTVLLGAPSKGSWRSRTSTNSLSWKRWWRRRCACTLRQGSSSPMNLASHATWPVQFTRQHACVHQPVGHRARRKRVGAPERVQAGALSKEQPTPWSRGGDSGFIISNVVVVVVVSFFSHTSANALNESDLLPKFELLNWNSIIHIRRRRRRRRRRSDDSNTVATGVIYGEAWFSS